MKILRIVALGATIFSANSYAGDHAINLVGRAGVIYRDNDVKKTGTPNSSSFNIDYLRTTFAGAAPPSVKYFVTMDLLGKTDNDVIDGTSSLIDEAFITKTFPTATSFTLGKKAVLIGGREYDYLNFDRYSLSSFFSSTPANQVGLTISHEFAGNNFIAQYFNGNKENGKVGTNAQSKFGYALGWYGNVLNGMIKPIIAYTVVPRTKGDTLADSSSSLIGLSSTTRANSGNDSYLSGGVQFSLPVGLTIEADYDLLTQKKAEHIFAPTEDVKLNSIVGLVRYSTDRFAPFVKFITETRKTDSIKAAERMAYDVGVEFKELKDDMLRYHVVYSGSTVKTGIDTSTTVKSSPSSILVGLKFDAAILK